MDEHEKPAEASLNSLGVEVTTVDGAEADKKVAKRSPKGHFLPGEQWEGQRGRKPGSRNRITFQRLELEEALRTELGHKGLDLLKRAINMAMQGDEKIMKVLLDKMLSTPKGDDAENAKDTDVRITIQNLTHGEQTTQVAALPRKATKELT